MDDRELAGLLGHSGVRVDPWENGHVWSCEGCGAATSYDLYESALSSAISHLRLVARRFRAECANSGITLEQGLQRRNGKIRLPHNGRVVKSVRPRGTS